jgi:hypothetical protein
VNGQCHSPVALYPGEGPPVPIVQEAEWAPEPARIQRQEKTSFASAGDRTPVGQSVVRHFTPDRNEKDESKVQTHLSGRAYLQISYSNVTDQCFDRRLETCSKSCPCVFIQGTSRPFKNFRTFPKFQACYD